MRVVILGGAGFLGSHLCERFVHSGSEVVCVDNFITGKIENILHLRSSSKFNLVEQDVSRELNIEGKVDLVLHFASPASPCDYLRFPLETLRAGSSGTENALDFALSRGARFVLASTSEVYGDPLEHPQREGYWGNVNPIGPRSVYDEAKRYAEALTEAYRREYGADTAIIRIFNTYGPRMSSGDGRVVPTLISQVLRGDPLTITGDGKQTRSFCYVDDLVEGVVRLAKADHPGPVNLGSPQELTMLSLAERICRLVGVPVDLRFIESPIDDPAVRQPNIEMAGRLLGWSPRVPVDEGLRYTITWYSERAGALVEKRAGACAEQ